MCAVIFMPKSKKQEKQEETRPGILPVSSIDSKRLTDEYAEADQVLTNRIQDKRFGFDTYDKLFNSYLDPARWPYSVKLANPRGFTGIFNKTTRMIGGRFTGKVDAQERGDELGARIATEHFKWSVERFNQSADNPIESKVAQWDLNARLYGAGFARVNWKTTSKKVGGKTVTTYDNWWLEVLNNRDVLTQPSRESVANSDYLIVRRYASLEQLERTQEDGAGYRKEAMAELKKAKDGSGREANYEPIVKTVKGLTGNDDRFEICTTYYKDKWVDWCPKRGTKGDQQALILRVMENPYLHGEIPVVPLVYIPSQEDIYGMSELQPVTALLKILSALQSQFIELVNKQLYPPTLVSTNETRIDTFKFKPKAFWLVNDPDRVRILDQKAGESISNFESVYKMIVTEFLEALGETGTGLSQVDLLGSGDKTATEVKDRAFLRNARDNFNKIMLTGALRKVMFLVFEMLRDPKFTDKNTVIKIVGRDALEYFDKEGLSDWGINDMGYDVVFNVAEQLNQNEDIRIAAEDNGESIFDLAYNLLVQEGAMNDFAEPMSPVMTAEGVVAKLDLVEDKNEGYLYVNPESDYQGQFDFKPDVEALGMPDSSSDYAARAGWYEQAKETEQSGALQREGWQLKHKEILTKLAELGKIKEADQYFEKAEEVGYEAIQGGAGVPGVGPGGQGVPGQQVVPGDQGAVQPPTGEGVPPAQGIPQQMGGAV